MRDLDQVNDGARVEVVALVCSAAEALFTLRPRDLGRPFQDLEVSYRPVELRSRIELYGLFSTGMLLFS